MKRHWLAVLIVALTCASAHAVDQYARYNGSCELGGQRVVTNGVQSAGKYQQSFPACTVTVFLHGTLIPASLFTDAAGLIPLANPFTATSTGDAGWYATDGRYDVQYSGGGILVPFAIPDINLCFSCTGGGGGGGTPGGSLGQTQYNGSGVVFAGTAGELVATAFPGADICAQITNALTALPATGGTILVPAGSYSACAGSGGIAIAINKPGVILRGMGSGSPMGLDVGATTIHLAAGVTGIDITGAKDHVQDLFLISASSGAGTDDGIRVRAIDATLERVSVKHFGRHGVNVDGGNSGGSADLWHFEDTESTNNFGDGFHWTSPCTDNHLGTGIQLNGSLNAGWGYYIDCGGANRFITVHATQNTTGGMFTGFSWNTWDNAYVESGVGSSFVIASGLSGVNASFQAFGQPTTITNPGATATGNLIHYYGVDNWPVYTNLLLGGQPGSTGNRTYMLRAGAAGSGSELSLFDYTDSQNVFTFDPTTKWLFGQKVTNTPSATLAGLNIGGIAGAPSTLANGDMWYDTVANKFRCYENGGATNCIGTGGGSGTVTHTAGALTLNKMVIGNGAADVTVDPNTTTDGSGNIVLTSIQTSGANGGLAGVEGTGAGLTPAVGQDLLYADSTKHCWHQNLNNVDVGCSIAANNSGLGFGSIFGAASLLNLSQTNNTIWGLTLQNAVATGGGAGGLSEFVDNNGDGFIGATLTGGTVVANVGLRQSGEAFLNGNGSIGNPASVAITIPSSATADFVLTNGSSVATGSPRLKWTGKTSGSAVLSVASIAGTPNPVLLPTATGTSGQVLQTDGANPQQTSWVTDIKSYNHSGTAQTVTHMVRDRCTLGTDCSVTLAGSAVFTSSSTYDCVAIDRTGANAIQFAPSSGSAFALTGTGTDTISYVCVGN